MQYVCAKWKFALITRRGSHFSLAGGHIFTSRGHTFTCRESEKMIKKYELSFGIFLDLLRVKSANFLLVIFRTPCKWKVRTFFWRTHIRNREQIFENTINKSLAPYPQKNSAVRSLNVFLRSLTLTRWFLLLLPSDAHVYTCTGTKTHPPVWFLKTPSFWERGGNGGVWEICENYDTQ